MWHGRLARWIKWRACDGGETKEGLDHGCANHDTEGKRFNSPIHCCDATKPLILFTGELCTSPLHCELLFVYIRHRLSCTQWGLASMTFQGQQIKPPPSMPSPTVHAERSGANSPSVFTWKHVSVKSGKGNVHFKNRGRRSIFDNVRCLLCSIVQKGTRKYNIKPHYDTVLCTKSAADAANLSISHYVSCIAGCVVRRHCEATLSTWLPMPEVKYTVLQDSRD